jgi:4-amino-4-deoxy-L-arabinose transferase-like glycosyltransferase
MMENAFPASRPLAIEQKVRVFPKIRLFAFLAAFTLLGLIGNDRLPLIDRDEGWYAQISRSMLEQGDWVVPRFRGEVFNGKPVLAFWFQAGAMAVFGSNSFAARLPSTACGLMTLCLVWWGVKKIADEGIAFWTIFVLGSSALFIGVSKLALIDSVLLLWIVIGEMSLAALYLGKREFRFAVLLWTAMGLALLTKGPVAVAMIAGTVAALVVFDVGRDFRSRAAWSRATRWLWFTRPWLAVLILPILVLPWGILVHERSPGFLQSSLVTSMLGPIFFKPLESRGSMHGFYLVMIWPCFLPWALLIPATMKSAWVQRQLPIIRFSVAAFIGPLFVIEGVQQKMAHYLVPLLPPLALLVAAMISRAVKNHEIVRGFAWRWGILLWGIPLAVAAAVPWMFVRQYHGMPYGVMSELTLAGFLTVGLSIWFFFTMRDRAAFIAMGIGSLCVSFVFTTMFLPAFSPLNAVRLAGIQMHQNGFKAAQSVGLIGYSEPSLTFYLDGQGTVFADNYLVTHSPDEWPKWIVLSSAIWKRLPPPQRGMLSLIGEFQIMSAGSSHGNTSIIVAQSRDVPSRSVLASRQPQF